MKVKKKIVNSPMRSFEKNYEIYKSPNNLLSSLKNTITNRADCWYLEKTGDGNLAMEYFSSVEERQCFFKKHKGFEISSEGLDGFINNLRGK